MKYNLKNRPNREIVDPNEAWQLLEDIDEWFEGFEAELREEIEECKAIIKKYPDDAVGKAGQLAVIAKNKEILGE